MALWLEHFKNTSLFLHTSNCLSSHNFSDIECTSKLIAPSFCVKNGLSFSIHSIRFDIGYFAVNFAVIGRYGQCISSKNHIAAPVRGIIDLKLPFCS